MSGGLGEGRDFCLACVRRKTVSGVGAVCEAYPAGIPLDVKTGDRPHDKPLADQYGKKYFRAKKGSEGLMASVRDLSDRARRGELVM